MLARWLLLTNVPAALADAATIARWYYFRWRIESMHKLLKSAGWQLESWLQRDGQRLLIKLLLALGGVRLDLGAGAAARRRVGGIQAVADAVERSADETEPCDHDQRPVGRAVGVAMCGGPTRSPRPRPTQRHAGELLAPLCKEQWMHSLVETNAQREREPEGASFLPCLPSYREQSSRNRIGGNSQFRRHRVFNTPGEASLRPHESLDAPGPVPPASPGSATWI